MPTPALKFFQVSSSSEVSMYSGIVLKIDYGFHYNDNRRVWTSNTRCNYLTHYSIKPNRLGGIGVPEFATLRRE